MHLARLNVNCTVALFVPVSWLFLTVQQLQLRAVRVHRVKVYRIVPVTHVVPTAERDATVAQHRPGPCRDSG